MFDKFKIAPFTYNVNGAIIFKQAVKLIKNNLRRHNYVKKCIKVAV